MNINLLTENDTTVFAESPFIIGSIIYAIIVIIGIAVLAVFVWLIVLLIKALQRYLKSSDIRAEKANTCKTLGEALKEQRIACN
ncbi:MAG: hypothetical protein K2K80_02480, partial [Clostridia bacterium]|nr:hypothetical protein [Clostridia bacterium]